MTDVQGARSLSEEQTRGKLFIHSLTSTHFHLCAQPKIHTWKQDVLICLHGGTEMPAWSDLNDLHFGDTTQGKRKSYSQFKRGGAISFILSSIW